MTNIKHVGTVIVPVSDQDRAIEFFVDKLGFELRSDIPYGEGSRWVDVAPPGADTTIALSPPREGDSISHEGTTAVVAFGTDDVDADHAELRGKGVDVDPDVMRMGDPVPPMFFFRDPDGNSFLIVQRA